MVSLRNQEVSELINKYNFIIDAQLYNDLICVICKRLLRNASNSICGCRYCYQCIEQYLSGKEKCCPRKVDDCKEQIINLQDISVDHVANKKILTIKVKCPETFCHFIDELRNMAQHIKSHEMKCLCFQLGCHHSLTDVQSSTINLNDKSYSHTKLVMDSMENMKNEIKFFKENFQKKEAMIEQIRFENFKRNEEINREKLNMREKETIFQSDLDKKQRLIDDLIIKNIQKEDQLIDLEERMIKLEIEQEKLRLELKSVAITIKMNQSIEYKCNNSMENELSQSTVGFEWKIKNFVKKINTAKNGINEMIYSEPFYSHVKGYKMRLRVDPNGNGAGEDTHLSVYFGIMEGEYDDMLSWPMKGEITIALIDQVTLLNYTSQIYKFDPTNKKYKCIFYKPSVRSECDNDYFFGTEEFIKLHELIDNPRLLSSGSIVLKCFVK